MYLAYPYIDTISIIVKFNEPFVSFPFKDFITFRQHIFLNLTNGITYWQVVGDGSFKAQHSFILKIFWKVWFNFWFILVKKFIQHWYWSYFNSVSVYYFTTYLIIVINFEVIPCNDPLTLVPRASSKPLDWPDPAVTLQAISDVDLLKVYY